VTVRQSSVAESAAPPAEPAPSPPRRRRAWGDGRLSALATAALLAALGVIWEIGSAAALWSAEILPAPSALFPALAAEHFPGERECCRLITEFVCGLSLDQSFMQRREIARQRGQQWARRGSNQNDSSLAARLQGAQDIGCLGLGVVEQRHAVLRGSHG